MSELNEVLGGEIISPDDIILFEEVFRNILIIADYGDIYPNKKKYINDKMTIIKVNTFHKQENIIKNNRVYYISMLISCSGLNILFKKGYYITNKYYITHNKLNGKIHIYDNKHLLKNTLLKKGLTPKTPF
jgi:hypothetical protein